MGDASGDGSYQLPALPALQKTALDIRSLSAENRGGKLQLVVALSTISNPWQAASGWSGVTLDIFIKTAPGGRSTLDDLRLSTPGALGWQEHYRLNGFAAQHWQLANPTGGSAEADQQPAQLLPMSPKVSVRGTEIILETDLPASNSYAYWVTTSAYTPLNASGVLSPSGDSSVNTLRSALAGSPAPLDVLLSGDQRSVYLSGVLPPVGQVKDYRSLFLLAGAFACLLLTTGLAIIVWRRP